MKKLIFVLILALLCAGSLFAQNEKDIIGLWYNAETPEGYSAIIKIEQAEDGTFFGTLIKLKDPLYTEGPNKGKPQLDLENKDPSLRARRIEGIKLIEGFTFQEHGGYKGGTIYNPEDGKTYYSKMSIRKDGKLKVRGSIDKLGWLGVTQIWCRVESK